MAHLSPSTFAEGASERPTDAPCDMCQGADNVTALRSMPGQNGRRKGFNICAPCACYAVECRERMGFVNQLFNWRKFRHMLTTDHPKTRKGRK